MIPPTDAASLVLRHRGVDQATEAIVEAIASFAYPTPTWRFAISAARGKKLSLRLVTWLHEQGVPEDDFNIKDDWDGHVTRRTAMDEAAKLGYMSVVVFLSEHSEIGLTTMAMEGAVMRGHFEIVKFLHENYEITPNAEMTTSACWNERVEIVKYLHEVMKAPFHTRAWELAAGKGNLELIKYLHHIHKNIPEEKRHEKNVWTSSVMEMAGLNGRMEVVKWLHDNRRERCSAEDFVKYARCYGALPFIKFLHEKKYPGDRHAALENATKEGVQDIAEYLQLVVSQEQNSKSWWRKLSKKSE